MYRIIIPIVLLLFITGCEKTIDFEKLQERDGTYYEVNSEKPFSGKVLGKYENGKTEYRGKYKDGYLNGVATWWYENGKKDSEGTVKNGKKNGLYTDWYENGQKSSEKTYNDGKKMD